MQKEIQKIYGEGGVNENWDKFSLERDPKFAEKFFSLMQENHIFPEEFGGFVFLSPSANKASREIMLAEFLDSAIRVSVGQKPLFIAADMFGKVDQRGFRPGFDTKKAPHFKNVSFQFISSEAENEPIGKESVNVVFDHLGALWYTAAQKGLQPDILRHDIEIVFREYARILKPGGAVIVDARDDVPRAIQSTALYLKGIFGEPLLGLKEYGFTAREIAGENMRYLVFEKEKQ